MVGKSILEWMVEQDRTVAYLARQADLETEMLIGVIAGGAVPTDDAVAALAEATGIPREQLQSNGVNPEDVEFLTDPLRCLTVKEVAARMKVSEDTVRWEMDAGVLGHITIGQRVKRIPVSALEKRLSGWRTKSEGGTGWQ